MNFKEASEYLNTLKISADVDGGEMHFPPEEGPKVAQALTAVGSDLSAPVHRIGDQVNVGFTDTVIPDGVETTLDVLNASVLSRLVLSREAITKLSQADVAVDVRRSTTAGRGRSDSVQHR